MIHSMTHSPVQVGALCAGYGGLEMGIAQVVDIETAWYSEIDHYANYVLRHHHPGVLNVGDVKAAPALNAPMVDMLTGGYPCQPFSHAGRRLGDEDPRHLWPAILSKIMRDLPRFVAFENVRGHATKGLLDVVNDLTGLGYTVHYYMFPASAVGACHRRERIFIFGTTDPVRRPEVSGESLVRQGGGYRRLDTGQEVTKGPRNGVAWGSFVVEGNGALDDVQLASSLLPTPAVNDMGAGKTVEAWDAWTERMRGEFGNGNGHGKSLSIEVLRLLPTPEAKLGRSGPDFARPGREKSGGHDLATAVRLLPTPTSRDYKGSTATRREPGMDRRQLDAVLEGGHRWGDYAPAIARWESALGRPAPAPTEPGPKGNPRLSPAFVEWMMGLPSGHVTASEIWEGAVNARGTTLRGDRGAGTIRNAQLKLLGNGVVPGQGAAATRAWIRDSGVALPMVTPRE